MSEKPISPLRQRMIEDMSLGNFGEKTRNDYIRNVKTFTAFLGRSPDTAMPGGSQRLVSPLHSLARICMRGIRSQMRLSS
jgi:hypothetical protein